MPAETPPVLSIVIPVHDEAPGLEELHARVSASVPERTEFIFVDDGSGDDTPAVLQGIARRDPRIRVLRLRRRFGKSMALSVGFRRARGSVVAMIDGDLQDDPAELPRLLAKLEEGWDLVGGWRRLRRDRPLKILGSRIFNRVVSVAGGLRVRDINCGLKVLRRRVLDDIELAGGFHRFLPLMAHWKGYRACELEVAHHPRRHGRSRYGGERVLEGLVDLMVVLFLLRFEARPSRFFVLAGAALGLVGTALSGYLAILRLVTGSIQSRFPLLALGLVSMVVGVQLLSLGFFGELLAHHFRSRGPLEPVIEELEDAGRPEAP